jgi:putative restriction endonuclease
MATWKQDIVRAMERIGGSGTLAEIGREIQAIRPALTPSWDATMRGTIERHSSDSRNFEGREDLFYSVGGIGNGVWGLRRE